MQPQRSETKVQSKTYDAGLAAYLQSIYNRMTAGVFITALTAWIVSSSPALMNLFLGGPQAYIVMFAPLAVLWFGFNPSTMDSGRLKMSFGLISLLYGISFAVIFLVFTGESIAKAFFIASGMFAGLSIFGYTTKKNLDGLGNFAIMGIWGVFLMSLVNLVLKEPMLFDLVSGLGIIAFAGLTAWQTQSMKETYNANIPAEALSRMSWMCALNLYIAFIALFQYILHFVGGRE